MYSSTNFNKILDSILLEESDVSDVSDVSAVAVVKFKNRWLLGISNSSDDRDGKWCHPGGHIKPRENPKKAAERECYEETGIKCKAHGEPFRMDKYKGIVFVPCKFTNTHYKIDVTENEFSVAGFFTLQEIRKLKPLYKNVIELIERARRRL